jgi:hypothetical protein
MPQQMDCQLALGRRDRFANCTRWRARRSPDHLLVRHPTVPSIGLLSGHLALRRLPTRWTSSSWRRSRTSSRTSFSPISKPNKNQELASLRPDPRDEVPNVRAWCSASPPNRDDLHLIQAEAEPLSLSHESQQVQGVAPVDVIARRGAPRAVRIPASSYSRSALRLAPLCFATSPISTNNGEKGDDRRALWN